MHTSLRLTCNLCWSLLYFSPSLYLPGSGMPLWGGHVLVAAVLQYFTLAPSKMHTSLWQTCSAYWSLLHFGPLLYHPGGGTPLWGRHVLFPAVLHYFTLPTCKMHTSLRQTCSVDPFCTSVVYCISSLTCFAAVLYILSLSKMAPRSLCYVVLLCGSLL